MAHLAIQFWVYKAKGNDCLEEEIRSLMFIVAFIIHNRDWGQEEKGTTEDETAGWHHGLDGRVSE